jgi:hypothetical protein
MEPLNSKILICLSSVFSLLFGAELVYSYEQSYSFNEAIKCSNAKVFIQTTYKKYPEFDTQCTKQTLKIVNGKKKVFKFLPYDGKLITKHFDADEKVLDAYVSQWACLKSKSGAHFILLWYDCSWGDEADYCVGSGNNQWERIFSLDGRDLTAGYPKKGPLLDTLYRKLDIYEISEKGIKLKPLKWISD